MSALLDRVVAVVDLRLGRPQPAAVLLCHQIDPGIRRPRSRPLAPQPHLAEPALILGRALELPSAYPLELTPPNPRPRVKAI